jgi:hypothetical protein
MGNLQVRFLEGWAPAMAPGYSTIWFFGDFHFYGNRVRHFRGQRLQEQELPLQIFSSAQILLPFDRSSRESRCPSYF